MAVETNNKKQYSAPALEKGLDIIELLATEVDGLRVTEITGRLSKTVGEIFRMLVVLEQRGYIDQIEGTDRYQLTLKLFGLATRFPPVKKLSDAAVPVMKRLAFMIEQSCHLVTFYDGKGHVVAQQDSSSARNFSVRLGAETSLMNTCSGHVLLSFASDERFKMMLNKIPKHHPKPSVNGFIGVSNKILADGFESMRSHQAQGVVDIGFPVFDSSGDIMAALVVPFMEFIDGSHPITIEESKAHIQTAAQDISKKLGFEGASA